MRALSLILSALASAATKEDRMRGAFWGALVSDALCLGSHYEYDAKARTRRKFRTSSEKNGRFCR